MPFERAFSRAPLAIGSATWRAARAIVFALVLGIGLFAALLLVVRLVVFPNIERFRGTLTAAIERQVGRPVAIDGLATGWDGWNPKLVIRGFRLGAPAQPAGGAALLELPEVDLTLAWTSLPFGEVRLKQLVIDGARLAIRRDADRIVHVAGFALDAARANEDSALLQWLLRQREVVVQHAVIAWTDEARQAPELVLDDVDFRLERRFGRHRFGLTGRPPPELAAPIDVRGDLDSAAWSDWRHADAQLYVRLDYADVAAWRAWVPLPLDLASGKGALRAWFTMAQGKVREVVADVELVDVRTRLAADLPELSLARVAGRAGWRFGDRTREFFSRGLGFTTPTGETFEPANVTLALDIADEGRIGQGRLAFDRLQLAPLRDLAAHLPLPPAWRDELVIRAPRGTLSHGTLEWQGPIDEPGTYAFQGDFADLGFASPEAMPAATGLTGHVSADQASGSVRLATRHATVSVPGVLAEPVRLDTADGTLRWRRSGAYTDIRIDRLQFSNAHAAGHVSGTYRYVAAAPGIVDLEGALDRADAAAVATYLPLSLNEGIRQWIGRAIRAGSVDAVRMRLKGDLAAFPFADGKSGIFTVDVQGRGFGLDYAEGWPPLTDIDGAVHFHGAAISVAATGARIRGVPLGRVTAEIADLRAPQPLLTVDGEANGATANFLRFIDDSPVADWTGHVTAGAEASGTGHLALKLGLMLHDPTANHVSGEYTFAGNALKLAGVPAVSQLNGRLVFTDHQVRARDITGEALGGPIKLEVSSSEGHVRVTGNGNANLVTVGREFPFPFAERVSGFADWSLRVDVRGEASSWTLESPLKGVAIDLPAPLGKEATQTLPMRMERQGVPGAAGQDTIVATFGDTAQLVLHRTTTGAAGTAARVDRALLALGGAARRVDGAAAEGPGFWVRAELPALDIDQWLAVKRSVSDTATATAAGTGALALTGVDLDVGVLTVFGRQFNAIQVNARHPADDWQLELRGREVAGTAAWSKPSADAPNGRLVARLRRLAPPAATDAGADSAAEISTEPAEAVNTAWPELDIAAESFASSGRDLGRLELVAKPRGAQWRIERLVITNDSGRLDATGVWRAGGRRQQTKLDVALDVKDGGGFLARFGHPGAVQGAPTRITGQLAWAGAPSDFDYPTLAGTFRIEVGAGRFMKIEPGIGKLLGVLSLQALPRRITLDFRDIFSEGFTFDHVSGTVHIMNGVMTTDNLRLSGPSAQVAISGDADLAHETQQLQVRVQPTLSAGVSAGAALLFLANPVLGAAVGAGSLLAQKVLRDPIEQIFSHRYAVTGSWSDPVVTRGGTATAAVPAEANGKLTP